MTGIFATIKVTGKPRCARCKRPFTPKSKGQDVGPTCARILAGQIHIDALITESDLMNDSELGSDDVIEVRDAKGKVTAVIV